MMVEMWEGLKGNVSHNALDAVVLFYLYRTGKRLDRLETAVKALAESVAFVNGRVGGLIMSSSASRPRRT